MKSFLDRSMEHCLELLNDESHNISEILKDLNVADRLLFIILLKELTTSYYDVYVEDIAKKMGKKETDHFIEIIREGYHDCVIEVKTMKEKT